MVELLFAQKKAILSLNRRIIYLSIMRFLGGLGMLVGIAALVLAEFTDFFGIDKYAVMGTAGFMAICAFFSASWFARNVESTQRELALIKNSITTCPKCGSHMMTGSLVCPTCYRNLSLYPYGTREMGYPP
jgi:hypothetical protein